MGQDFITLACEALPKMRLVIEGAIVRFESSLCDLTLSVDAAIALNDVGVALYYLQEEIGALQGMFVERR